MSSLHGKMCLLLYPVVRRDKEAKAKAFPILGVRGGKEDHAAQHRYSGANATALLICPGVPSGAADIVINRSMKC